MLKLHCMPLRGMKECIVIYLCKKLGVQITGPRYWENLIDGDIDKMLEKLGTGGNPGSPAESCGIIAGELLSY